MAEQEGLGPYVSVGNGTALWAHRSPDLAALWSGVEILSGHLDGKSLHSTLDPNLKIESKLEKSSEKESQKRVGVLRTLTCLFNGSQ